MKDSDAETSIQVAENFVSDVRSGLTTLFDYRPNLKWEKLRIKDEEAIMKALESVIKIAKWAMNE